MFYAPESFSKFSPLNNLAYINLDSNEEGLFNTYNRNELYEPFNYKNENSFLEGEGPTNYKTIFFNFEKDKQPPKIDVCTFENIEIIFGKDYTAFEQILNFFKYNSDIEEVEKKYLGQKIKRSKNSITNIEGLKYSKGRKKNDDKSQRSHNKSSSDNIIKKIKSKLFENMLQFINNILNPSDIGINEKKKILKDIDYNYINRLKKEYDLDLLNKSIKDLLSFKVSSKFNCGDNFNKDLIEELMITKSNNKFLMFALNMTFREWLDLFTLKKEPKEFKEELNKNMTKVKDTIEDVYKKNKDRNYISSFIFYLYNYENWFIMKRSKKIEIKCQSSF